MNLDKVLETLDQMRTNISGAHDAMPLALDEATNRSFDVDGRLHVAITNISKAAVNPYKGSEIPNYEQLGLEKDKIYYLFRDPDELAKGAATFNNIPLLSKHVPVNAVDYHPELVLGSTGTDASFEAPYLRNSLVVWAKPGIDDVESDEKKELSSAYRYRPDMTPGVYEGQKYDGVMREIIGNHIALVKDGRAGSDVVVGDSRENLDAGLVAGETKEKAMGKKITRQAAIALGVLGHWLEPKLAMDAKIDLSKIVEGLTRDNFKEKKPDIIKRLEKATKGKLAQDASIGEVAEILDLIDSHDVAGDEPEFNAEKMEVPGTIEGDRHHARDHEKRLVQDDDPVAQVEGFLKDKLSGADLQHVCNIMRGGAEDDVDGTHAEGEEQLEELGAAMDDPESAQERADNEEGKEWHEGKGEPSGKKGASAFDRRSKAMDRKKAMDKRRHAMDDPPPFKGMPKKGGGGVMDKHAMDAALKSAVEEAKKQTLAVQRDIRKAEREVRPWVGDLAMDEATCADDVYGAALENLGVKTDDIHPSAWPTILKLQPLPGARKSDNSRPARVAMDSKSTQSFNELFPDAGRIKLM